MAVWKKGQTGNPKGRPAAVPADIKALAKEHSPTAIETLVKVMQDGKAPPAARVAAANSILDRGYGKPAQAITDADGGTPKVIVEIVRFSADTE